jgi:dienelactone hydrolase
VIFILTLLAGAPALAQTAPSVPGVDAPELARLGPNAVGLRRLRLAPTGPDERALDVDLWYPARPSPGARPVVYAGALTPEHATDPPVRFTNPGIAVRDAAPAASGPYPLVVLSHGHSGTPQAMAWMAENLASKGYVVAGLYHHDPPITDAAAFGVPVKWRPLDQAFAARALQAMARVQGSGLSRLIDASKVALIGYSMGGYGAVSLVARPDARHVAGLKAVVAISPWGGEARPAAWSKAQLAAITTPMLFIVGDRDDIVGYADGVKSIYDGATGAPRYMLVFENAGHSIGMGPASAETYASLWGLDYFEDPVWRKDRLIAVELHVVTAFLDRYVKGDASRDAYLNVPTSRGDDAVWPTGAGPAAYDALSPGVAPITVWKGFPRRGVTGLRLFHAP